MESEFTYDGPDAFTHLGWDCEGRPRLYYIDRTGILNSGRPILVEFDDDKGRYIVRCRKDDFQTPDKVRRWESERLRDPIIIPYVPGVGRPLRFDIRYKRPEGTENG